MTGASATFALVHLSCTDLCPPQLNSLCHTAGHELKIKTHSYEHPPYIFYELYRLQREQGCSSNLQIDYPGSTERRLRGEAIKHSSGELPGLRGEPPLSDCGCKSPGKTSKGSPGLVGFTTNQTHD